VVAPELRSFDFTDEVYFQAPVHLVGPCTHLAYSAGDFVSPKLASFLAISLPFLPYVDFQTNRGVIKDLENTIFQRAKSPLK